MCISDFSTKSRGSRTPASASRDKKGEKELSEKEKGRTPVESRRSAVTGRRGLLVVSCYC